MAKDKRQQTDFDPESLLTGHGAGQSRVRLAPAQVIYGEADPGDAVFYVESGWVKISAVTPNGKEAVIGIRRPGEFFGSRCLIGRRAGTAVALTACSLIRLTTAGLIRMLREEPDFAVMFAIHLVRQSISDQSNLVDHLTNPAEKRLARALLRLADGVDGSDDPRPISVPLHQAVLANLIGTTRPRVSFFMNKFKRRGFIEYDREGHLIVRAGLRRFLLGS